MELQDVQFEVQDGVGIITMNRPERLNASSSDMTQGMIHILENLTPDVRAIVLTGAGRAFSAGGDVKGMNESLNNPDGPARVEAQSRGRCGVGGFLELRPPYHRSRQRAFGWSWALLRLHVRHQDRL